MSIAFLTSLSFSIFIAGIIALIRFNKINKAYYPFLFCVWFACLNEILSFLLVRKHYNNSINNNIYILIESILITLLFNNFGLFTKKKILFYFLIISFILVWLFENFVLGKTTNFAVYFNIYSSFVIVLMSVSTVNEVIVSIRKNIFTNATFLLCVCFIIYFTYQVLIYSFWIYGVGSAKGFLLNIFSILIYINLLTNLVYALAILWMPRKQVFTMPS